MDNSLIIIYALWLCPVIGLALASYTEYRSKRYRIIRNILVFFSALPLLGIFISISTTLTKLDWVLFTLPYLLVSWLIWLGIFQKKRPWKVISIIFAFIVFGIGYFTSTVGMLGIMFVFAEFDYKNEQALDDRLVYKEVTLGNAISQYRGKGVILTRKVKWMPLLEREIFKKEYYGVEVYMGDLDVTYDSETQELHLETAINWADTTLFWRDKVLIPK